MANGGGRPAGCCIAGADGQSWPRRSAWLLAFHSTSQLEANRDFRFDPAARFAGAAHRRPSKRAAVWTATAARPGDARVSGARLDRCCCSSSAGRQLWAEAGLGFDGLTACKWATQRLAPPALELSLRRGGAVSEPQESGAPTSTSRRCPESPGAHAGHFRCRASLARMTGQGAGRRVGWHSDARHGVSGLRTRGRRCARAARRSTRCG